MTVYYENWSPRIFPGFYETSIGPDGMIESYLQDECPEGYEWELKTGGWQKIGDEVAEWWVDEMSSNLKDKSIIKSMKFSSINSSRYYNFSTDKLVIEMDVDVDALEKYCFETNAEAFNKYLKDNWTDYDGFASFTPNSIEEFKAKYEKRRGKKDNVDLLIEFYLLENVNFNEIEEQAFYSLSPAEMNSFYDNLCLTSYETYKHYDFEWNDVDQEYVATTEIDA